MAETLVLSDLLPEELVDDILIRLPIKSIVRLESVAKSWKSRLHSTSFNELYKKRNNKSESESESETKRMELEDLYKMAPKLLQKRGKIRTQISVMGPSSNGIYCITSAPFNPFGYCAYRRESEIALCNLATRRFKFLPPFPPRLCRELGCVIWNNAVFGFHRAPSHGYSVVVVINYQEPDAQYSNSIFNCFTVLVYTTNSRDWEILLDYVPGKKAVGTPNAIMAFTQRLANIVTPKEVCSQRLLKGCWHWMVQQDQTFVVLSFDFAHQSFRLIEGLPVYDKTLRSIDVVVLRDRLAAICLTTYTEVCDVWMMMEYGVEKSWTRIFHIQNSCLGPVTTLYKIECSKKEESDDVFIEKLFFVDDLIQVIVSFDHQGGCQLTPYEFEDPIYLNIGGISSYKETLEYLH